MAGSTYLRRVEAINRGQGQSDVERGMQAGETIGKLLGGLGTAIQGAQKNALANRLMNQQSISSQPGAGQTQDLGTLPGGPQPGGPQSSTADPDPDPTSVNYNIPPGGTGGQAPEPTYTTQDMPDLSQAAAASSLQPSAQPAQGGDNWNLSGFGGGSGAGTVGGLLHTGGVQELDLQKEMLAMQGTRAAQANAQQAAALKLADAQAKANGTGPYAVDAATKRANLLAAQNKLLNPAGSKTTKPDPNAPPVDLTQAPVANNDQLVKAYESIHGKGSFATAMNAFNEPATIPDPNNPGQTIANPNAPVVTANTVSYGPAAKRTNLPIGEAQIFAKQANAQRVKQNLPLLPVPGETDQSLGSKTNPYQVKTKLDALSRPRGSWVRTPTGQIAQVQ